MSTSPLLLPLWAAIAFAVGLPLAGLSQPFDLSITSPALDRWMYPHNATPGTRPTAPVFGTLGDESGVDSRHGQFLVGFDLSNVLTTNLGPSRYLIRRCRLSVTVSRDRSFVLDPTSDPAATYLPTNSPAYLPDSDAGRPIELFGVGFRNGYTSETFAEDSPFGPADAGQRNAFSVGYDSTGSLIDVGNNVGKTNLTFPVVEAHPFAVGASTTIASGDFVPAGTTLDFELNLADPFVVQYLQEACHTGRLRLILTSLQTSGFGGAPAWAEFYTRDSVLGSPPAIVFSGTTVQPNDTDANGILDDWERHYFGKLVGPGPTDSDGDGATDATEFDAGTDPSRPEDVLAITVAARRSDNEIRIRFRHAPSRRYILESCVDFQSWKPVAGATIVFEVGRGGAEWVTTADVSAPRFYRVNVDRPVAPKP